ncbi:MAG: ThiF family adenylyltransferase [bacterium]
MRTLSEYEKDYYSRNTLIPEIGEAGQAKLLESSVLVIGSGGLGSPALYYLAASGIGEIGVADSDNVEVSNLQRQILHGVDDVGTEKTISAAESMRRLRPDVVLNLYQERINDESGPEIIRRYDFVIEATDNFESKFLINDVCVSEGKAYTHAGILGMFGQVMTIVPGESPCYRCVFQKMPAPGRVKGTAQLGVLGTVPGVLGTVQATEAIKYLLGLGGLLTGRLLTYNAAQMKFREVALPKDKHCLACSSASDVKAAG